MRKGLRLSFVLIGLAVFTGTLVPAAARAGDELLELFVQAGYAYKQADYTKAVTFYEEILQQGWENGVVYYNLGNSYFKQNQLGKAVLNYERARRLIPRDSDLNANRRYALSLIKNYNVTSADTFWERWIKAYCDYFTVDEVSVILLVALVLSAAAHLGGLCFNWPKRIRMITFTLFCGVFIFQLISLSEKLNNEKDHAVAISSVEAKYEPRQEATTYFELSEGWEVRILSTQGEWFKVERLDGKVGWVPGKSVESLDMQEFDNCLRGLTAGSSCSQRRPHVF